MEIESLLATINTAAPDEASPQGSPLVEAYRAIWYRIAKVACLKLMHCPLVDPDREILHRYGPRRVLTPTSLLNSSKELNEDS